MRPLVAIAGVVVWASLGACRGSTLRPRVDAATATGGGVTPAGDAPELGSAPRKGFRRLDDPFAGHDAAPCGEAGGDAALALVNTWRASSGLGALACSPALETLAAAHAAYLAANDAGGLTDRHQEVEGNQGFTGVGVGERADALGLDRSAFWISEGVGGTGSPQAVVEAHLATVYHRSPLLTPGARYFSYARRDGSAPQVVMESLAWLDVSGLHAAVFPPDGADEVPGAFGAAGEVPNPTPMLAAPGYPISAHFPRYLEQRSGAEPTATADEFTLTTEAGAAVAANLLAPAADPELSRADLFLVPDEALVADQIYEAKIVAHYGAINLQRRWRFRTRGLAP